MTDDEPLYTSRKVFSHMHPLLVGHGKPESGIQVLFGPIDHLLHSEFRSSAGFETSPYNIGQV